MEWELCSERQTLGSVNHQTVGLDEDIMLQRLLDTQQITVDTLGLIQGRKNFYYVPDTTVFMVLQCVIKIWFKTIPKTWGHIFGTACMCMFIFTSDSVDESVPMLSSIWPTSSSSSTWGRSRHASSVGIFDLSASLAWAVFSGRPLDLTAVLSCSICFSWSFISCSVLLRWDCNFFWVSSVSLILSLNAYKCYYH